jgi:hypothetical protein
MAVVQFSLHLSFKDHEAVLTGILGVAAALILRHSDSGAPEPSRHLVRSVWPHFDD